MSFEFRDQKRPRQNYAAEIHCRAFLATSRKYAFSNYLYICREGKREREDGYFKTTRASIPILEFLNSSMKGDRPRFRKDIKVVRLLSTEYRRSKMSLAKFRSNMIMRGMELEPGARSQLCALRGIHVETNETTRTRLFSVEQ